MAIDPKDLARQIAQNRVVQAAGRFVSGVQQAGNKFLSQPVQVSRPIANTVNRINSTASQVGNLNTFNPYNPQNYRVGAALGTRMTQSSNPAIRAVGGFQENALGYGASSLGNVSGGVGNAFQGIRAGNTRQAVKGLGQTAFGAGQLGIGASALAAIPSAAALGAGGAAINAGLSKLQGQDPFSAAGRGFSEGFRMRGVTRFTDPRIASIASRVAPGAGILGQQLATRGVTGVGNAIEDEIIDAFNQTKRGAWDRAASVALGAALGGNSQAFDFIRGKIKRELPKPQAKKALQLIEKVRKDGTKYTQSVGKGGFGKKTELGFKTQKTVETPGTFVDDTTRKGLKQVGPNKFVRTYAETGQPVFGTIAGLEPEVDENGKLTGRVKYNPIKGAAGLAVMGGVKSKAGREALTKIGIDDLQIPIKKLKARQGFEVGQVLPHFKGKGQFEVTGKIGKDSYKGVVTFADGTKQETGISGANLRKYYNQATQPTKGVEARKYKNAEDVSKRLQELSDSPEFQEFYRGGKISGKSWNEYQQLSRTYRDLLDKTSQPTKGAQGANPSGMSKVGKSLDTQAPAKIDSVNNRALIKQPQQVKFDLPTSQPSDSLAQGPRKVAREVVPQSTEKVSPQVQNSSGKILSQEKSPYFNTKRLNISKKKQGEVQEAVISAKPAIEKVVGKKLKNKEVIEFANRSARVINQATSRQQTLEWESAMLKARQQLAAQAKSGTVTPEYLDTLVTVKSQASDIARKLQSFSIGADPKLVTSKEAILEAVLKVEQDADKVLAATKGVDFNDQKQAQEFYRKFIKPTSEDWIDTLRYNSMLSSPNTHINNFASNWQGTGIVAPIEKTITGSLDALKSAITGSPRKYYTGEGVAYAKGYYSSVGKAARAFSNVMTGKSLSKNLDTRQIPLAQKGASGAVYKTLSLPMQLLEAGDQFFTALTKGGVESSLSYRMSKGTNPGDIARLADEESARRLFRSELGENNGSAVLNALDVVANKVQSLKGSENAIVRTIAKYSLPFLRTPTNILKQGVEYSPLGIITTVGSKTKTEQISRAIIGTSVGVSAAMLLGTDRLSWAEPTGEEQKNAFRAAGMQPYSVRIGTDKDGNAQWWSYSKLHPAISFNLALVAAVKHAEDEKRLNETQVDAILSGLGNWLNFYADQSYMKNIGDLVASSKGDVDRKISLAGNYAQQFIPFRALMGWVNRIVDPYQRQVDKDGSALQKQFQYLATQIPGLSGKVPLRKDSLGNPIENQNRLLNAVSPVRVTTEKSAAKAQYKQLKDKSRAENNRSDIRAALKERYEGGQRNFSTSTLPDSVTSSSEFNQTSLSEVERDFIKERIKLGDTTVTPKELELAYLGPSIALPNSNRYEKGIRDSKLFSSLSDIQNSDTLSQDQKSTLKARIAQEVGLTTQDLDYYSVAKEDTDLKTLYVLDQLDKVESEEQLIQTLVNGRREVNGSVVVADGVIDNLVDEGRISEQMGEQLKDLDFDSTGKAKPKKGRKPRKVTVRAITPPKIRDVVGQRRRNTVKGVKIRGIQGLGRLKTPKKKSKNSVIRR